MGTVDYRCAELPRTRTQINRKKNKKQLLLGNKKSKFTLNIPKSNKTSYPITSNTKRGNPNLQELLSKAVKIPKFYIDGENTKNTA